MPRLRAALPPGPLDLIGDVHGEIDALRRLLRKLGCDPERRRAERPIVFVGDLVDRGPDSPAVVELVAELVAAGIGYATLGNHELNLLRGERKEGSGWFWGDFDDGFYSRGGGERVPFPSVAASARQRREFLDFFRGWPLVLERDDLRVVHAAWSPRALAKLPVAGDAAALSEAFETTLRADLDRRGVRKAAAVERSEWADLRNPGVRPMALLNNVAEEDEAEQRGNPVKILTSGPERRVPYARVFYVGGKWRFVERVRWWRRYRAAPAVVIGHYWRRRVTDQDRPPELDDVFAGVGPWDWLGPTGRVFCVDYSVGLRFRERDEGRRNGFKHGLAAMRWPERKLVFDDRERAQGTRGFGAAVRVET